ncbi:MAG: helix-hairpin-helix domain-containing protein [Ruminococcus sp.]|nr:helix-hairpin-helix domain-containing protein [Ruminococcus sp.]
MKKDYKIFILLLIILIGIFTYRYIDKRSQKASTFVIKPIIQQETTIPATTENIVTIDVTTEISSAKSTESIKITEEITINSEEYTEVADLYININTATHDELVKLNGIGDYRAEQIITYRNENGGFKNIEELINVSGIGKEIFDSICEYVYVENPVYYVETEIIDETSSEFIEETTAEFTESVLTLEDYAPININEADAEILMLLPYIDKEIADKIIALRNEISGFRNTYELLYIEELNKEKVSEIIKYACI